MLKNLPANARDVREAGSIPGSGRSPGEGKGPLLENTSQNTGEFHGLYSPRGHKESDTTE